MFELFTSRRITDIVNGLQDNTITDSVECDDILVKNQVFENAACSTIESVLQVNDFCQPRIKDPMINLDNTQVKNYAKILTHSFLSVQLI